MIHFKMSLEAHFRCLLILGRKGQFVCLSSSQRVTLNFAILANLGVSLRLFCHFVPAHVLTEDFYAKMAI